MDTQTIKKENYIPLLRGGWITQPNYSIWIDGSKYYGLPEDYEKYFIKRETYVYKKPKY